MSSLNVATESLANTALDPPPPTALHLQRLSALQNFLVARVAAGGVADRSFGDQLDPGVEWKVRVLCDSTCVIRELEGSFLAVS